MRGMGALFVGGMCAVATLPVLQLACGDDLELDSSPSDANAPLDAATGNDAAAEATGLSGCAAHLDAQLCADFDDDGGLFVGRASGTRTNVLNAVIFGDAAVPITVADEGFSKPSAMRSRLLEVIDGGEGTAAAQTTTLGTERSKLRLSFRLRIVSLDQIGRTQLFSIFFQPECSLYATYEKGVGRLDLSCGSARSIAFILPAPGQEWHRFVVTLDATGDAGVGFSINDTTYPIAPISNAQANSGTPRIELGFHSRWPTTGGELLFDDVVIDTE